MYCNQISFHFSIVFSCLFIFSSCFSTTQFPHDNDYPETWKSTYVDQMEPEDQQLLANFLYLLYANAFLDLLMQRHFTPLLQLSQAVRNNLSDPYNPNNELIHLRTLTNKIARITKVRLIYTQMLDACLHYYDQHKNDILEEALRDLQLYASDALHIWAEEAQEETIIILEKSAKTMVNSAQTMYSGANLFTSLSNGILPFRTDERDKSLAIFNLVLKSTPTFIDATDKTINALNDTCDHALKIICLGTKIYKQHYQALYDIITSDSFDKQYATNLFDVNTLLPQEHRTLLPDADHIYEHMLATTQFLTQIQS